MRFGLVSVDADPSSFERVGAVAETDTDTAAGCVSDAALASFFVMLAAAESRPQQQNKSTHFW